MLHDIQSELSILGAILLDNSIIKLVAGQLYQNDFHNVIHSQIYGAMVEMTGAVDMVTVNTELEKRHGRGFAAELATCMETVPAPGDWKYYAASVIACSQRRKYREAGLTLSVESESGQDSPDTIGIKAIENLRKIMRRTPVEAVNIKTQCIEAIQEFSALYGAGGGLVGHSTGITKLDNLLCGIRPQSLNLIAGRAKHGKTSMAVQISDHIQSPENSVLMFSLEMPARDILTKIVSQRTGINSQSIMRGNTSEWETGRVMDEFEKIAGSGWIIRDNPNQTIEQIESTIYQTHAESPLSMIVVDHVQLIRHSFREKRYQAIGRAAMTLYEISKTLRVPVILVSQLGRGAEEGDTPRLSDLRESGDLEQNATSVTFIYRPALTGKNVPKEDTDIIVIANRYGPIGKFKAHMSLLTQFFYEEKGEDAL
ncbi:replicative DNA helicase [Sulfuricurvum sp.]|uniref:replicative DNA helicase n=1 Tax=Sulfuricurvum sp. TaxID=2025608 RepID=UPI00356A6FEE